MSASNPGSRPAVSVLRLIRGSIGLACITLVLAGCGGGGGGGGGGGASNPPTSNPPPSTPSAEDQAKAQSAQLRMHLAYLTQASDQSPGTVDPLLTVTWLDTFDNETGYKVEQRIGGGAWQVLETLPPIDGGSGIWQSPIFSSSDTGSYRVSATFRDFSLTLHAAPGESEIDIATTPQLQVLAAPESDGSLRVSVANVGSAQSVEYFLGSSPFGSAKVARVTGGGDFATIVPPTRLVQDPAPSLVAYVRKSTGLTMQAGLMINPINAGPAVLMYAVPAPAANSLLLTARASSPYGIQTVQFFVNGQPEQELNSPDRSGNWVHAIDPTTLTANQNTFRAVATASDGASASMDVEYTLDTLPALSVEGVFDGMIATGGRLQLHATFGENIPGTVLSVDLGHGNNIARTRASPFDLDYSLAGLSGERILTVRAESPTGKVSTRSYYVILPSTERTYELISTDASELLAANVGTLLYKKHSGAIVLRNAAGVETPLQVPAGLSFSHWWLTAGKVVAQERVNRHVHVFTGPGQTRDLTPSLNFPGIQALPLVRGEWLTALWGILEFSAHNLSTDASFVVPRASPYFQCEIDTTPGNERLLFAATIDGTSGIYSHWLNTGVTDLLLAGTYDEVRTDGVRLVVRTDRQLQVAPLDNPSAMTVLSNAGSLYDVKDGLIGFSDEHGNVVVIDDGSTTIPLATFGSWDTNSIADGYVVYSDSGRMHSWSPASGKNLVADATVPTLHTQGVIYLLTGRQPGALYRTTLP